MIKKAMQIILIVIVLLVSLLLFFYLIQSKLIYFPMPLDNNARIRYAPHEISVIKEGVRLHGWFVRGEVSEHKSLLVYYGGNAEEVSSNLPILTQLGVGSYLFMNYRGYGDSGGQPSESKLLDDALYILDHIRAKENIDLSNIVLMGRSLGTGVASHVASKRKVRGVILISPFDSLTNIARHHYPIIPVQYMLKHKFNSLSLAPKITSPALIIFGADDQIVPPKFSRNLINHWGGKNEGVLVEGANHYNIHLQDQYWPAIRIFLKSLSAEEVP